MVTFETPFAVALNRLLDTEPWARERLAPFAGEIVRFRFPPLPALAFEVLAGGRLAPADPQASHALELSFGPEAFTALVQGEDQFLRAVRVTGNAQLAQEVLLLARHLRWDFEEDLSRVVGDAVAHRIAGLARDFVAWQADTARRLADSFAEYAGGEGRLLVSRGELEAFSARTAALRDAVARLDARLRRLG